MVVAASPSQCVELTCDETEVQLAKKFMLILLDDHFLCFDGSQALTRMCESDEQEQASMQVPRSVFDSM